MSELKKVTVIERFDLGAKTYAPGPAEVPADKVAKLLEKKLIAPPEAAGDAAQSGSTLETELLAVVVPQSKDGEDAVDTVERLVSERDEATQKTVLLLGENLKVSQLVAAMHEAALGEVREPIRGVVEDIEDVRQRAQAADRAETELEALQNGVEAVAKTIPPLAGLERTENESGIDYLNRYATHFKEVIVNDEKSQANGEAKTQGQVTGVSVTAEELTKVTGSAKAALALLEAKFDTREKLDAASDADLEKLPDLAEGRIKKLRDWLAA